LSVFQLLLLDLFMLLFLFATLLSKARTLFAFFLIVVVVIALDEVALGVGLIEDMLLVLLGLSEKSLDDSNGA